MPSPPGQYDARSYWSSLHREPSLRAVGQSGLPVAFNTWLYRIGRHNVRSFLARHGLRDLSGMTVLDVGSGTGYWIEVWRDMRAARIDGIDLVPDAADRLQARFPEGTFTSGDIADDGVVSGDGRYDLVSVMNVLLHILDEDRFTAATLNVARAVRPGGRLILAEPALVHPRPNEGLRAGASSTARPVARYRSALEAGGLRFVAMGASTVVGANPIETGDPAFRRYASIWRRATGWAKRWPRTVGAIGAGLMLADRALIRTGAAPSGKLLLFERPSSDSPDRTHIEPRPSP